MQKSSVILYAALKSPKYLMALKISDIEQEGTRQSLDYAYKLRKGSYTCNITQ